MTKGKGQKDKEKLEDTKEVMRCRKQKDRKYNDKRKRVKGLREA